MDRLKHFYRDIDGQFTVIEFGPAIFIVGADHRRFVLGQCELEPNIRIGVTIGDVMHCLPNGPAAGTVFSIKLRIDKTAGGSGEPSRELADSINALAPGGGRDLIIEREFAYRSR